MCTVAAGVYSAAGGLRAVALTDVLQVSIMFVGGIAIAILGLGAAGGIDGFATALREDHPTHLDAYLPADHPEFPWPAVILGLGFVLSPAYWCGSQAILQRTLGARSEWDASASMMFAAFAKTLVPLLIVFPGLLALVMKADIEYPDMALPWVVKNVLPPGLSGLMFVAMIAALQSALDAGLNSASLMITRDLWGVWRGGSAGDDLRIGRAVAVAILLAGAVTAPMVGRLGGIYLFVQTLLSLFQGPMLALLAFGALTRIATPRAGTVALLAGLALAGWLTWLDMNLLYVAAITFAFSAAILTGVGIIAPGRQADAIDSLVYRRV